jgi:hypothetical protein
MQFLEQRALNYKGFVMKCIMILKVHLCFTGCHLPNSYGKMPTLRLLGDSIHVFATACR